MHLGTDFDLSQENEYKLHAYENQTNRTVCAMYSIQWYSFLIYKRTIVSSDIVIEKKYTLAIIDIEESMKGVHLTAVIFGYGSSCNFCITYM